jgi:hypothetical protein
MERYEDLVQKCRRELDGQYEQAEGWPEVDLSAVEVEILTDRFFARPMAVLAAARGLRHAVARRPGAQPPGIVLLGSYRCILSFDLRPAPEHGQWRDPGPPAEPRAALAPVSVLHPRRGATAPGAARTNRAHHPLLPTGVFSRTELLLKGEIERTLSPVRVPR